MNKIVKQNNTRFIPNRLQFNNFVKNKSGIVGQVDTFLKTIGNNYLGFGGIGDLILLLASSYDDSSGKILFFANNVELSKKFIEVFNIQSLVLANIMGQPLANNIYNIFLSSNHKPSAHLADGLNYGDWSNEDKYISRIKRKVNWKEKFGCEKENILIVAPHGSSKDDSRRRYLTQNEYSLLINNNIDKYDKIYSIGSSENISFYGLPIDNKCYWLNSNNIIDATGTQVTINIKDMFKIINSCNLCISVDTWIKTYTAFINIDTKVIKTRWNGQYRSYGSECTDYIFLNKKIWPNLDLVEFETLL